MATPTPTAQTTTPGTTNGNLAPTQGDGEMVGIQPGAMQGIVAPTLFAQQAVQQLTSRAFAIDAKEKIALKNRDCTLILFYGENTESRRLLNIWNTAASQTAGPIFAAVNLSMERDLATSFTELLSEGGHPFHWAGLQGIPFILVYRNGWPVAFYNGERAVQPIIDYALTLACQANYREPTQLAAGQQAETNIGMPGWASYEHDRRTSLEYTSDRPIRGYRADIANYVVGSAEDRRAQQLEAQSRAIQERQEATGTVLPGTTPGAVAPRDIAVAGTAAGQTQEARQEAAANRAAALEETAQLQESTAAAAAVRTAEPAAPI